MNVMVKISLTFTQNILERLYGSNSTALSTNSIPSRTRNANDFTIGSMGAW